MDITAQKIKNNPLAFYRLAKMKKAQGYIFFSVNYFIANFLDKKGNGFTVKVFKQPLKEFEISIYSVKRFTVSINTIAVA